MSKLPLYIGTSIFTLAPNLTTAFSKNYFIASSATTSSTSTSSFYASLMSPASGALLCAISMASSLARSSLISLSIALFSTGWLNTSSRRHCVDVSNTSRRYHPNSPTEINFVSALIPLWRRPPFPPWDYVTSRSWIFKLLSRIDSSSLQHTPNAQHTGPFCVTRKVELPMPSLFGAPGNNQIREY
jgi:hypothetical protein